MKVHYLPTLASNHTKPEELSTLIQNAPKIPAAVKTKKDLIKWREGDHTRHVFFSPYEGITAASRVSTKQDGNKPWVIHGIVIDYDQVLTSDQEMVDAITNNQSPDFPVGYASRTFSGGAHLVWEFEKPVKVVNPTMLSKFIETFVIQARCKKILGGFDDMSLKPTLYYTLYDNWKTFGDIVPSAMTENILFNVGKNVRTYDDEGPALPWNVIEDELHKNFPGQWKGRVEHGARGKRFWDPTATHPNAAMLTATGVAYFTDGGGFLPWGSPELFGASVVRRHQASAIASAVQDVYYDGSRFFRHQNDRWLSDNMEVTKLNLSVRGGLSRVTPKNKQFSEVDEAIVHISTNQRVEGCFPFVYDHNKLVHRHDGLFINTSNVKCHEMSDNPVTWGQGFPFIANWLDHFFIDQHQRDIFLSWLHWTYMNAYNGDPKKGQTMFIVGSAGVGKTLMSHRLLDWMLGGHSDISKYLMGSDQYNENLFKTGLATVDDQEPASDYKGHMKFSALVKKITANQDLSMRKMYSGAVDIKWLGRVFITLNQDPESMQLLPNLDINNKDKLIILRTAKKKVKFPSDVESVIKSELACFCRYIYDYQVPSHLIGEARYHVTSFIDPTLLDEVEYSNPDFVVLELLQTWRESYFTANPDETHWFGKVTDIVRELEVEFNGERRLLKDVSPAWLSRKLRGIVTKHDWIEMCMDGDDRGFKVTNPLLS